MLPICFTLNKYNLDTLGFIEYEDDIGIFISICIDVLWLTYGNSFSNFAKSIAETTSHESLHNLFFDECIPEQYHHIMISKLHLGLFNLEISMDYLKKISRRKKDNDNIASIAYA